VTLYSKLYLPEQDDSWCARPSARLFEVLNNSGQGDGSARWIAVLEGPGGVRRVALGDPVQATDARWVNTLYVSSWLLESIGLEADVESIQAIRFEKSEQMPRASRLGFRVIGDIPEEFDLRDLLEEPLSQLGVLEEGLIIPVPILDGCHLFVQTCEPAGEPVFLDGLEVALEIEQDVAEPAATASPVNEAAEPEAQLEDFASMLPPVAPATSVAPNLAGLAAARLGRSRVAAAAAAAASTSFTPFSGTGRRLGDHI